MKPGDHVITGSLKHNSVIRPLLYLKQKGVSFTKIMATPQGKISPNEIESNIRKNTKLFVFTHASNVIGTILPVAEPAVLAEMAHLTVFSFGGIVSQV